MVDIIKLITDDKLKDLFTSSKVYIKNFNEATSSDALLNNAINLDEELKTVSKSAPEKEISEGGSDDHMLYIYTSGTTGMPKAAIMTQAR